MVVRVSDLATSLIDRLATALVHVLRFAADESLIYFDSAATFAAISNLGLDNESAIRECLAKPMQHEPSRLLGYTQVAAKFIRTDTVLAVRQKPQSGEPLLQRNRGILEDGPNLDGMLVCRSPGIASVSDS